MIKQPENVDGMKMTQKIKIEVVKLVLKDRLNIRIKPLIKKTCKILDLVHCNLLGPLFFQLQNRDTDTQ